MPHPTAARPAPAGLAAALVGACTPAPPTASDPAAPPAQTVVVVIGCTLRADHTSLHGYKRDTTPYLARLGHSGAWFRRALATSGWTRPGVAAVVTGRHPVQMGMDNDPHRAIPDEFGTLAEHFQSAGWATHGITANPNANAVFGHSQGFDTYVDATDKMDDRVGRGGGRMWGVEVVDDLLARASGAQGPLYLQAVLLDAHSPWRKEYQRQAAQLHIPTKNKTDRYDASLGKLDEALQHLDEGLARLGRSDRLLVVIGDHGQGLREPVWAGNGHGGRLYDAHTHVPWVLHGPGVANGHAIDGFAGQLDLFPTVAALAGLPAPDGLHGEALLDEVQGRSAHSRVSEHLASSRVRKADLRRLTTEEGVVIEARGPTKAPRRRTLELFAVDDWTQARDLSLEAPDQAFALKGRMDAAWTALDDSAVIVPVRVKDNENELLQALGYLDQEGAEGL